MRKLLIRSGLLLVLITCVLALIVTIISNILLAGLKDTITEATNNYFVQDTLIKKAIYLPPCFILIKDVAFRAKNQSAERPTLHIPTILIKFSLREFLLKRKLSISSISFDKPNAGYLQFREFLQKNFFQISEFIKDLPKQDINLSVRDAVITRTFKHPFLCPVTINEIFPSSI